MTAVRIVIAAVLALFLITGLRRGLIRQVLEVVGIIVAFIAVGSGHSQDSLGPNIVEPGMRRGPWEQEVAGSNPVAPTTLNIGLAK